MSLTEIYQHFLRDIKVTRWQEWASTITQIASVWYARKNNVLVYPTGIIGVLLAAYVYFFLVHPPPLRRCVAEYLLFHHECVWLVQLGAKKRRGTIHVSNKLVYKKRVVGWHWLLFNFLGGDICCTGKAHQQQYPHVGFTGVCIRHHSHVVDGKKKN